MEDNEMMAPDTMDAALESAWGGDDDDGADTMDTAEQGADQLSAEQEATPASEQPGEQPAADQLQEGQADQQAPELFTLRNREETRQVTREELIAMAQKGWDYDAVRQERDQLRQERGQTAPVMNYFNQRAQQHNMTPVQYLEALQKQELMRQGLTEQQADTKMAMERQRADLDAREASVRQKEEQQNSVLRKAQESAQARKSEIDSFLKAFPGVKPTDIPKEVWASVREGQSLTNAYVMHENRRLQAELAAERQNKDNRQRTPGAMGGNSAGELDELDRYWAEDD